MPYPSVLEGVFTTRHYTNPLKSQDADSDNKNETVSDVTEFTRPFCSSCYFREVQEIPRYTAITVFL